VIDKKKYKKNYEVRNRLINLNWVSRNIIKLSQKPAAHGSELSFPTISEIKRNFPISKLTGFGYPMAPGNLVDGEGIMDPKGKIPNNWLPFLRR